MACSKIILHLPNTNFNHQMNTNTTITHSTLDEGYDYFVTDRWNNQLHFKISTFEVPSGWLSEAVEVLDATSENEPRVFQVLTTFDSDWDTDDAELQLQDKIEKGVNKRYLQRVNGQYRWADDNESLTIAGRIVWENEIRNSRFDFFLQVDGKKVTIEEFVELLEEVQGWNFKFQVIDMTDDID